VDDKMKYFLFDQGIKCILAGFQNLQFVLSGFAQHLTSHFARSFSNLVLLKGDIAVFSESGSARAPGTSRRQWLVLGKRRNTANERFPARPKGAKQMTQYGVTALNKDQPLSAVCALSWIICLALKMVISPLRSTSYRNGFSNDQANCFASYCALPDPW
jgi:hypothetical protein